MRLMSKMFAMAAMGVLALGASARAENNPAYDSWAKHKPGTMVKHKGVTEAAGTKTEMETTMTLSEVTPEKAIVEVKTSMVMMGNKMDQPATKIEIPAAAPAANATGNTDAPKADVKTSDEKVTVAGKEYDCKVTESKMSQSGMDVSSKVWTCTDVPGSMVKTVSTTTGAVASSTTMELVEVVVK